LLAPKALDKVLGASVPSFGEALAYLIHHARRAVVLQSAEQLLLLDREIDPLQVALEVAGEHVPQEVYGRRPPFAYAFVILNRSRRVASPPARLRQLAGARIEAAPFRL